jgi:hypothetical protein
MYHEALKLDPQNQESKKALTEKIKLTFGDCLRRLSKSG